MVEPTSCLAIKKKIKLPQHNVNCIDLCASTFTEIPDTYMCTSLKRALNNNTKCMQVFKIALIMIPFYHAVHPFFLGRGVAEKKYTDRELMRRFKLSTFRWL